MQTTDQQQELSAEEAKQYWASLESDAGNTDDVETKPAATAPAAAQAEPEPEEDPYSGLSAAQRNRMIGLEQMVQQQSSRLRNVEGHIGGLKSQLTAQQHAAQSATAPTARELTAAQGSPEAMKELQESYPEFASAIESYVTTTTDALRQELAARTAVPAGLSRSEVDVLLNEHTVEVLHPGWKKDVSQPAFIGWLQQQPAEVQRLAASDAATDAVKLLDAYKAPSAAQTQRNNRLEAQASIPSGRTASANRGKSVDEMTDAEFWAHLDKQEAKKGK